MRAPPTTPSFAEGPLTASVALRATVSWRTPAVAGAPQLVQSGGAPTFEPGVKVAGSEIHPLITPTEG